MFKVQCVKVRLERETAAHLKLAHYNELAVRDDRWSEAIAVGNFAFVEKVKGELGFKAAHRDVIEADGTYALREPINRRQA